jgi:multidrug transporter EmrE-like cation transporter
VSRVERGEDREPPPPREPHEPHERHELPERTALDVDYRPHTHAPLRTRRTRLMLIGVIVLSVALAAAAQLTLKYGMKQVGAIRSADLQEPVQTVLRVARQPAVWGGLLLFGVSAVFWLIVLSRVSLSFAYPFAALTYVLILLFDRFILRTDVPGLRWAGVFLIITGIVFISRTPHA